MALLLRCRPRSKRPHSTTWSGHPPPLHLQIWQLFLSHMCMRISMPSAGVGFIQTLISHSYTPTILKKPFPSHLMGHFSNPSSPCRSASRLLALCPLPRTPSDVPAHALPFRNWVGLQFCPDEASSTLLPLPGSLCLPLRHVLLSHTRPHGP